MVERITMTNPDKLDILTQASKEMIENAKAWSENYDIPIIEIFEHFQKVLERQINAQIEETPEQNPLDFFEL